MTNSSPREESVTGYNSKNDNRSTDEPLEYSNMNRGVKQAIRYSILREAQLKTPVFEAYRSICTYFGNIMGYQDYEYLYYGLLNGELDINSDMTRDTNLATFEYIPPEIAEMILSNLGTMEKLIASKVSKLFRDLINGKITSSNCFYLYFHHDEAILDLSGDCIIYEKVDGGCMMKLKRSKEAEEDKSRVFVEGGDFIQMSVEDFVTLIETVDREVSTFHIDANTGESDELEKFCSLLTKSFERISHRTKCQDVIFIGIDLMTVATILPCLEQVEYIAIAKLIQKESDREYVEKIKNSDQWKNTMGICSMGPTPFSIFDVLHIPQPTFECFELTAPDLVQIREKLFQLPNSTHEFTREIYLEFDYDMEQLWNAFGPIDPDNDPELQYHKDPNSDLILRFFFNEDDDAIFICRGYP